MAHNSLTSPTADASGEGPPASPKGDTIHELPKMTLDPSIPAGHRGRRGRRSSVSAESDHSDLPWVKKTVPKTVEQIKRIRACLATSFVFGSVDKAALQDIVDCMTEKKVNQGDVVIHQNWPGDYFYVVESGKYDVLKANAPSEAPKKVFHYDNSGSFGELALMYNAPRAATVTATTRGILWCVDRPTFNHIIVKGQREKRANYERLLKKVPILSKVTDAERAQVADCLETRDYENGEKIITEGDIGSSFFLILSGECVATQAAGGLAEDIDETKTPAHVEVGRMKAGDYFGERALITNERRAANVVAVGRTTCAVMAKDAFERLLGDVRGIMHRRIESYHTAIDIRKLNINGGGGAT